LHVSEVLQIVKKAERIMAEQHEPSELFPIKALDH